MKGRWLGLILLSAALVRFGLLGAAWLDPDRLFTPDSAQYAELSETLARSNTFGRDGQLEIGRTPGYPLLLLLGAPFGAARWRAVAIAQILLDVLLVYLTFLLGRMLCSRRVGLWAAALGAITAVAAVASVRILSDGVFAFATMLGVVLLIHHFKTSRRWSLLTAAAAIGLSCYVRPAGLVTALICLIVLMFRRGRLRHTAAFAGIVLCCVGPWVVRNAGRCGYVGFSSFAADSMYYFAAPELISRREAVDAASARRAMRSEMRAYAIDHHPLSPGAGARYRRRRAIQIITSDPWTYLGIHLRGCAGSFLPAATDVLEITGLTRGERGTVDVLHAEGLLAAVRHYFGDDVRVFLLAIPMVAILLVKYLGVFVCAVYRIRLGISAGQWLVLLIVVVSALLPGPFGLPRYRVPISPFLSVAGAAGLVMLMDWMRKIAARSR